MLMAQKEEEEGSSGHYSHRTSAIRETLRNLQQTLQCPICLEQLKKPCMTQCLHQFCRECIQTVISTANKPKCPLCKEPISRRGLTDNSRTEAAMLALKELEAALLMDAGLTSTPPPALRPLVEERGGTPEMIVHSLWHPTPQKPKDWT